MAEDRVPTFALTVSVDPETFPIGHGVGRVHFPIDLEFLRDGGVEDLKDEFLALLDGQGFGSDRIQTTKLPDIGGRLGGDVKV